MKTALNHFTFIFLTIAAATVAVAEPAGKELPPPLPTRSSSEVIGIYDSRVVAYAWFWSEHGVEERERLIAAAKAARAQGRDSATAETAIQSFQDASHLQVFSTAPIDNVLADLADQLPAIRQEAGVTRLISKWDYERLASYGEAPRVNVTDALVSALITPNEQQAATIKSLKENEPLPLARARKLLRDGKL